MRVLGVDPGLAATGVALVTGAAGRVESFSFGCVRTGANGPASRRLLHIVGEIREVVTAKKPDLMVVEDIFTLKVFPRSAVLLGKASGVILAAGALCGVPVEEVAVREVKKILTGNGNASKSQLERAVRARLGRGEAIRPSHAADALALALIGLYRGPPLPTRIPAP